MQINAFNFASNHVKMVPCRGAYLGSGPLVVKIKLKVCNKDLESSDCLSIAHEQ